MKRERTAQPELKMRELGKLSIDEWIDKAVVIRDKIQDKLGYKVKTIAVTVSAAPSVTVTLEPKP